MQLFAMSERASLGLITSVAEVGQALHHLVSGIAYRPPSYTQ